MILTQLGSGTLISPTKARNRYRICQGKVVPVSVLEQKSLRICMYAHHLSNQDLVSG